MWPHSTLMVGIAAAAARSWPLILATATRVGPGSTAADAVVVDLEHGVPDHDKHRAREVAAAYLQRADHPVWVRINDIHIAHGRPTSTWSATPRPGCRRCRVADNGIGRRCHSHA